MQYTNLIPNSEYLFVVVAFGRSGAYSPVWNLNTNMLRMSVGFAAQLGPVITLYNSFFTLHLRQRRLPLAARSVVGGAAAGALGRAPHLQLDGAGRRPAR